MGWPVETWIVYDRLAKSSFMVPLFFRKPIRNYPTCQKSLKPLVPPLSLSLPPLPLHSPFTMPDSFFQSDKKRKRPSRGDNSRDTKKPYEKPFRPALYGKGGKTGSTSRSKSIDEDLSDDGGVDLDTMDFRKGRNEEDISDEEFLDVNETAAEKRVRLARGYLEKVREEVEAGQLGRSVSIELQADTV